MIIITDNDSFKIGKFVFQIKKNFLTQLSIQLIEISLSLKMSKYKIIIIFVKQFNFKNYIFQVIIDRTMEMKNCIKL